MASTAFASRAVCVYLLVSRRRVVLTVIVCLDVAILSWIGHGVYLLVG